MRIGRYLAVTAVIILMTFVCYHQALNAPFVFDDWHDIEGNRHLRITSLSLREVTAVVLKSPSWTRPVVNISFALNFYLHAYDPFGYHLFNTVLHAATGTIFFWLVLSIFRSDRRTHADPVYWKAGAPFLTAVTGALMWLSHPIQTQSVTYAVQRANGLAAFFYVLSLLCYVRGRMTNSSGQRWTCFTACVLSGLLAFGCKENAYTLPLLVLLIEWLFLQEGDVQWLKRQLPWLTGAVFLLAWPAAWYFKAHGLDWEALWTGYNSQGAALPVKFMTEWRVVLFYVSLLLCPLPSRLNLDHDIPLSAGCLAPFTTGLSLAAIIAVAGGAVYLIKRDRLAAFCLLWFLTTLAMESSGILNEIAFEHRLYLPAMFICVFSVRMLRSVFTGHGMFLMFFLVGWGMFSFWTVQRNQVWTDSVALWQDSAAKSPGKIRLHHNLGMALHNRGRYREAIGAYHAALRLNPKNAKPYNNWGTALTAMGHHDEAVRVIEKGLNITPKDALLHYNLGQVKAQMGDLKGASESYGHAVELVPGFDKALVALANIMADTGRWNEAVTTYWKALKVNPENADTYRYLGVAYFAMGRIDQARACFRKAETLSERTLSNWETLSGDP